MSIFDRAKRAFERSRRTAQRPIPASSPSAHERARQAALNRPAGSQSPSRSAPGLLGRAFRWAMSRLGPAGQIVNAVLDLREGQDIEQRVEQLVGELDRARRDNPAGAATYDALIQAAQDVLDYAQTQAPPLREGAPPFVTGGGMSPPPVGKPLPVATPIRPPPGAPPSPPVGPPAPSPGAGDQLVPTIPVPTQPGAAPPLPGEQAEWSDEVHVRSSNVWSFRYHFPSSTLAITYKAPALNPRVKNRPGSIKGIAGKSITGKLDAPGPTYHYGHVPVRVFRLLTGASSAGKAVWSHVRVRGSQWKHQYAYRLAQGSIQAGERGRPGVWVPRRVTRRGYRTRTVPFAGRGRRGWITSSLPQQLTAPPDRGEPDRGEPDRGGPDRGQSSMF